MVASFTFGASRGVQTISETVDGKRLNFSDA